MTLPQARTCEWSLDDLPVHSRRKKSCDRPATHTTCDPVKGVVCEWHVCRCSKRIDVRKSHPGKRHRWANLGNYDENSCKTCTVCGLVLRRAAEPPSRWRFEWNGETLLDWGSIKRHPPCPPTDVLPATPATEGETP